MPSYQQCSNYPDSKNLKPAPSYSEGTVKPEADSQMPSSIPGKPQSDIYGNKLTK
jgi:hypothetical protein